ncbi:hypothetical protein [Arthrobacter sp. JCM 19049]|uniref:hypothetical protein n=1 Tax=Arthrobacter sp. JCM 19049 TaxID=1460643 RepID=UPI0006D07265
MRGIHYYASSVAVCHTSEEGKVTWLAGAIQAPALGAEYYAGRGLGAWKQDLATRTTTRLSGPQQTTAKVLATGFGYDATRRQFQARVLTDLLETTSTCGAWGRPRWICAWWPRARSTPTPSTAPRNMTGPPAR